MVFRLGSRYAAFQEEPSAYGRKDPCDDVENDDVARYHRAGEAVEPRAARLGELLSGRLVLAGVSRALQLHGNAVASVVAPQVQGQAATGRDFSSLAPVRAFWARSSDSAWAQ